MLGINTNLSEFITTHRKIFFYVEIVFNVIIIFNSTILSFAIQIDFTNMSFTYKNVSFFE